MDFAWTEERIELLKKLWLEGLSGGLIAKQLHGPSRNAVIGKAHRLGLGGRGGTSNLPREPSMRAQRVRKNGNPLGTIRFERLAKKVKERTRITEQGKVMTVFETQPLPERVEDFAIPVEQRKTFRELETGMCKWPVGDPQEPDFFFCGGVAKEGEPYCSGHCAVAFQPKTAFVRRNRNHGEQQRRVE